jgi:hypothetical protein
VAGLSGESTVNFARLCLATVSLTVLTCCLAAAAAHGAEAKKASPLPGPYDFHETKAYRALSADERAKLAVIQCDFALLWGALDRFAEEHQGRPPKALAELVPHYLTQLPADPLAEKDSDTGEAGQYSYEPGNMNAWCLSSAGLKDFPFLAAKGNFGLYVCKGIWLGKNVVETGASAGELPPARELYDFHDSEGFRSLAPEQKAKADSVRQDLTMLWGALDMYAQQHGGKAPSSLGELLPIYLPELPHDLFASEATDETRTEGGGYRYRLGDYQDWVLSSAGGKNNYYFCKGIWFGGVNVAP